MILQNAELFGCDDSDSEDGDSDREEEEEGGDSAEEEAFNPRAAGIDFEHLMRPLFPGAPEHANVGSVLYNFLKWKSDNAVKHKAFNDNLKMIGMVLPPGHHLPGCYKTCLKAIGERRCKP